MNIASLAEKQSPSAKLEGSALAFLWDLIKISNHLVVRKIVLSASIIVVIFAIISLVNLWSQYKEPKLLEQEAIWIARYQHYALNNANIENIASLIYENEKIKIDISNWLKIEGDESAVFRSSKRYSKGYLFVYYDQSIHWK